MAASAVRGGGEEGERGGCRIPGAMVAVWAKARGDNEQAAVGHGRRAGGKHTALLGGQPCPECF